MHRVALGDGVHHVPGADGRALEPAHVGGGAASRHNGVVAWLIRVPLVVRAAGLDDFQIRDEREERHDDVRVGHREVVNHAGIRHLERNLVHDVAIGIGDIDHDVPRGIALGLVGKGDELVAMQIELRMRRQAHRP